MNAELTELRRLLEEAHNHIWTCSYCACGKSSDGNISINWDRYDDQPTVHVRHMCGFDAPDGYWEDPPAGVVDCDSHWTTFDSLDAAVDEIRHWHQVEMAKDHTNCERRYREELEAFEATR